MPARQEGPSLSADASPQSLLEETLKRNLAPVFRHVAVSLVRRHALDRQRDASAKGIRNRLAQLALGDLDAGDLQLDIAGSGLENAESVQSKGLQSHRDVDIVEQAPVRPPVDRRRAKLQITEHRLASA